MYKTSTTKFSQRERESSIDYKYIYFYRYYVVCGFYTHTFILYTRGLA